jgi:hypothetical protein
MTLDELALVITAIAIPVALLVLFYSMRVRNRGDSAEIGLGSEAAERWRYRSKHSVSSERMKAASEELRTLKLEREILSDAIRRLYEAQAEGRITLEEREQLAEEYKEKMRKVKDALTENESVVALHELESMQEDLAKLFDDRFGELNVKIETLRSKIGLQPEEIPITVLPQIQEDEKTTPTTEKTRKRKPRKTPQKPRKTAAEERIEKIRAEVERVLDRLEQMEIET